jgi:hypothetical protein
MKANFISLTNLAKDCSKINLVKFCKYLNKTPSQLENFCNSKIAFKQSKHICISVYCNIKKKTERWIRLCLEKITIKQAGQPMTSVFLVLKRQGEILV